MHANSDIWQQLNAMYICLCSHNDALHVKPSTIDSPHTALKIHLTGIVFACNDLKRDMHRCAKPQWQHEHDPRCTAGNAQNMDYIEEKNVSDNRVTGGERVNPPFPPPSPPRCFCVNADLPAACIVVQLAVA